MYANRYMNKCMHVCAFVRIVLSPRTAPLLAMSSPSVIIAAGLATVGIAAGMLAFALSKPQGALLSLGPRWHEEWPGTGGNWGIFFPLRNRRYLSGRCIGRWE